MSAPRSSSMTQVEPGKSELEVHGFPGFGMISPKSVLPKMMSDQRSPEAPRVGTSGWLSIDTSVESSRAVPSAPPHPTRPVAAMHRTRTFLMTLLLRAARAELRDQRVRDEDGADLH